MPTVHPTALVDPKATLAADVTVDPYAVIGPHVTIGAGTTIGPHAIVAGRTTIGARCKVSAGAVVGAISQDKKHRSQRSFLTIGDENVIREYVTISCGTEERSTTTIGHHNLFMAYSHVAHDCVIGDRCVLANSATLAGYVVLEDDVTVGGLAAIHQFVRLGRLAIVGGCSKVVQDVVPFATSDGHPARIYGLNVIGLRRAGLSPATRQALHRAFRTLFYSGLATSKALKQLETGSAPSPEVRHLIAFVRQSKRGCCRAAVPSR